MSPPLFAITLLSAAALGYEVLLLRLFSIVQWHHFAYMIISLALLGYGASGTFLALTRHWAQHRFTMLFAINAVLFGLSAIAGFLIAQRIPFNPLELLWDWQQSFYLFAMYLLLAIPFFFVANCIGLCFYHFRDHLGRVYSADLLGAGLGALGVVLLLFVVSPLEALTILGVLGVVSAALSVLPNRQNLLWQGTLWLLAAAIIFFTHSSATRQISPYKGLSQTLQTMGAKVLQERTSPLGLLTVVENHKIPFRYAPGLSLNSPVYPPEQLGVFTDGDALTVINRYTGQRETLKYLDFLTSALPYHLLEHPKVLLLGAGGGTDVLQALYHNASHADAVELNPQLIDLVKRDYAEFAGRLYDQNKVQIHIAEARGFVAGRQTHYDLIQVALLDSFGASSAGLYALSENYLYTVEALEQFIARLNPGGLLAITRWVKLPPRDGLKLFATAVTALEKSGVETPGTRLALIRGWKTSTLLVKNGAFTTPEIATIRRFCEERSFDVAYYPDISPSAPNQYNLLNRPYFYEGAIALLGTTREEFLTRYKYDITPATDNHPYFFNFFKWQLLPELFSKRGSGGMGLLEWGYPLLIATLIQAAFASILLILLPLLLIRTRTNGTNGKKTLVQKKRVFVYFFLLGLAFLFVEMAFIQKFILFLSHPLYAVAVVLCAFLIFAGLGSRYSSRQSFLTPKYALFQKWGFASNPSLYAVAGIAIFALLYLVLLPPLLQWLTPLPDIAKVLISLILIAPLAFWMGMPFPLGLARLADNAPDLIPWAWAINGCASVLSAVLATVLAIHFGFTAVILLAVILYGIAAFSYQFVSDQ
jgi:hypothetical protein